MMPKFWSKEETLQSFALYGTAVGVGTLFLPIQLGSAGAAVLLIIALIVQPLTCQPHKTLCQFILSSETSAGEGITGVVTHYYGKRIGNLITTFYSIVFFVVVLIYVVAITNSLIRQLTKHIAIGPRIRMLISLGVVPVLNLIFLVGRQTTIRVVGFLVFLPTTYFLFLSLYLTGSWQPMLLTDQMSFNQYTLHQVWVSTPVMAFAFSRTPIIFTFVIDRREKCDEQVMGKYKRIMKVAYVTICLSVLFLVLSCLLSIPTSYIEDVRDEGVTILSVLSVIPNAPAWLSISGIIVTVIVTSKPFLNTYFGVTEGIMEVIKTSLYQIDVKKSRTFNHALSIMLVSTATFIICCVNPNAISMIYAISGPLVVMILFIMPTLSTYLIPAPKPYCSVGNLITLIVGLLCTSAISLGQNVLLNGLSR